MNKPAITTSKRREPAEYLDLPLALFTIADLTDALGIERSAEVLECNQRYIYTVRNSNALAVNRVMTLIDTVKADEESCRQRLVVLRQAQALREQQRKATAGA